MKFKDNMSMTDRIDCLARWIIVNSIIYYDYNFNVVPDAKYDENSKLLVFLLSKFGEQAKNCYYWNVIHDFDGTTGFDLKDRLTPEHKEYLNKISMTVIRSYKGIKH